MSELMQTNWNNIANSVKSYNAGDATKVRYDAVRDVINAQEYTSSEFVDAIKFSSPEDFKVALSNDEEWIKSLSKYNTDRLHGADRGEGSLTNMVNSNATKTETTNFNTVQNVKTNAQTGKVEISDKVTKHGGGTTTDVTAIASSAIAAVAAASVGITVGKIIDSLLYNANPDFWDEHGMSSLNPETWSSITAGDNSFGSKLFNFVFQIDEDTGNPTAYIDEETFAYMVAYMISRGVFDETTTTDTITEETMTDLGWENTTEIIESSLFSTVTIMSEFGDQVYTWEVVSGSDIHMAFAVDEDDTQFSPYFASESPFVLTQKMNGGSPVTINSQPTSKLGESYYSYTGINVMGGANYSCSGHVNTIRESFNSTQFQANIAYIMLYGAHHSSGGVAGITSQAGATQFDASSINDPTNITAVLNALKAQFPQLWANKIETSYDGINSVNYIPVSMATGGQGIQPTTIGATAQEPEVDVTNTTDELLKTLIDMIQHPELQNGMESDVDTPPLPPNPNGDGAGVGNTPAVIIPTGSASALWAIYNPSQSELNSFGAWLWSPNFVDQLLKLFNDPMQAIIGLHKIFATPPTSGTGNIVVGYLNSGVSANLVSNQYTEVDCGTVSLTEYYGNTLDYVNTDVYLYLPFVGIVPLNVEDVTRANINVKYKVDVLTGACLASVSVTRDANAGGQLYVYSGNCAVQYPLSSGSYMGIVSGILGVAGSVASTIMSGGAMLPMALGAGAMAMNSAKTRVEHSGSLSGNAGAMGIKKPYLIIRRPQTKIAENFQVFNGESNNIYTPLSSCTGYTRAKYVHLENIPATGNELTEIEELLKSGVIISGGSVPNV